MKFALRLAINFVVILVFAGVITVNASASTIPGDPLYGIKRTWEKVQLALTIPEQNRQQLQTKMGNERRAEIEKVLQLHRQTKGEYEGVLEQITASQCVVNGMKFTITPQTKFEDNPKVGQWVELDVQIQSDGQMIVQELDAENIGDDEQTPTAYPTHTTGTTDDHPITNTPAVIPSQMPAHIDDIDDDHDNEEDIEEDPDDDKDIEEDLDDDKDVEEDLDDDDQPGITASPGAVPSVIPADQHDTDGDHDEDKDSNNDHDHNDNGEED